MAMIPTTITEEKVRVPGLMTRVFNVNIFGRTIVTTVTSSHIEFEEWIREVFAYSYRYNFPRHIGFEIEVDEENGHIGTVQLCFGNRCLVFRFVQGRWPWRHYPPMLNEFLSDRHNVFVGTKMRLKMHRLRNEFAGIKEWVECEDLDEYAPELRHVKRILLDSIGLLHDIQSDWTRSFDLTSRQVHFACINSLLNLHIARYNQIESMFWSAFGLVPFGYC